MLSAHELEKGLGLLLSVCEENKTERFGGKNMDIISKEFQV